MEASLESHEKTCEPTAGCLREGGMDLDLAAPINELDSGMFADANKLEFEGAALLRDQIKELEGTIDGSQPVKEGNRTLSKLSSDSKRRKSPKRQSYRYD